MPAAKKRERRYALPQAAGIPAEDGIRLAPVQAPPQLRWQFQPCYPWRGCAGLAQDRVRTLSSASTWGPEVEGEPDAVAAAADLIDDVDTARGMVQPDRAAVPGRRTDVAGGRVRIWARARAESAGLPPLRPVLRSCA